MQGYVLTVERKMNVAPEVIFEVLSDASKHSIIDGSGMVRRFAGVIRDAALAEAWADELRSATESVRQSRVEAARLSPVHAAMNASVSTESSTVRVIERAP